ncbi:MAG: hypothetical protein U9R38_04190 [Candidatus Margulisiibacteriota bacterium]|nr:hypothetical protein [Candidatus Margulisiibacteriota bacterium]
MKKLFIAKLIALAASLWLLSSGMVFAQQGTYPQLDISGFKKWEYKKADVSPLKNYFSGLTQLGGYYPTFTGGPWQERLQLRILGQLSENLSVSYDLEQQPEVPDRFDVRVKYYNNELTFGDITANFSGNEFASTSKYLNGVMLTAKDSWYDITTVPSAKLKSQTQNLTSQKGNNTKGPYNLGHGSIVEGSETVELNGNPLTRNVDYTIDYFEGKVTFNEILTSADEFKYSYEYTNILDLFFPALSKRDFFGFQSRFTIDPEEFGRPLPRPQPIIKSDRQTFPISGTVESERSEAEASGEYQLNHIPVVQFGEKLTFMGTELRKNEDYLIRYNEGYIKLLTRFLPSPEEPLIVEYQYHTTSAETEAIPGIGSRGPYQFKHQHIVPESERIEVDGKLFVRDLDYTINYQTSEIVFGIFISTTSLIKAKYQYMETALPAIPQSKHPKELKVGVTYLRESAKAGSVADSATAIDGAVGQDIIDDNYTMYLTNKPIIPTSEANYNVIVKLDGAALSREVDYVFPKTESDPNNAGDYIVTPEAKLAYRNDRSDPSDGFDTGTIKFINPASISATSEIVVTYAYYKSIVGRYSGMGDGTQGPYFLKNVRNLVPGSETVQVWDQGSSQITTYTRNSSFEGDAGDTGYSINYHQDNPYIEFNNPLDTNKNFQIIYQYVPPSGFTSQDISQSVVGLDGSFKIGELFKVDTAFARSDIDQVIAKLATTEIFSGNDAKNYTLHSPTEIIENSEKLYLNDVLINKDQDYYISYAKPGQITFYYVTPSSQDAIRIDYDYQDSSQIASVTTKVGYAYKLGAETKLLNDSLVIGGSTKKIDYDFTPMGGTSIGRGSRYLDYNLRYQPEDFHSFFTSYSFKENNSPLANRRDKFLRTYDHSVSTGINPNGNVQIDVGLRKYWAKDDVATTSESHSSDTRQDTYSINIIPSQWERGALKYNQKYDGKKSFSQSDSEKDSGSFSESTSDFIHANGELKFTDRFSAGYDFQKSEPKTIAENSSSVEATRDLSRSIDTAYNFNTDLTFGPLDKWTARVNLINHEGQTDYKNFVSTSEVITTRNETYHSDLTPFSQLNTSFDHNRQEQSTLVIGGVNPKTERTSANATLTPYSWTNIKWSGSNSESIPETGEKFKTTGDADTYSLNWNPIAHDRIKLTSTFNKSENIQTGPSGTIEGIQTDTNTFSQNYRVSLVPHQNVPVNVGLALENYQNKNDHPNTSSQIDTKTENLTKNLGVTFTPNPGLTLSSDYNEKITKVIKDLNVSPSERIKTIIDSKVSYKVYEWGTLIYNQQDEKNGGEVQSGSVANLDIEKTTKTYSLNINVPVDNPVMTSFVFIASLKSVDYRDLANSDNNFVATLMTFEGSLNF